MIIDDPIKANDAESETALANAAAWFLNTALSRRDNLDTGMIIVAMQRLHVNDLSGVLIEKGYPALVIPAIATEPADYFVNDQKFYHRPVGELLQPSRDSCEALEEIKREIGSRLFAAQYQQNPVPPEGNMIRANWLRRYNFSPKDHQFVRVVLSCDPSGKAGNHNDYTAITINGFDKRDVYVLHVARGHWTIMEMRHHIRSLATEWNAETILVEDTSSGMGLIQLLREDASLNVVGRKPKGTKEDRMSKHLGRFEAGRILLPTEAIWLADFESELLAFPVGRYDDQVDALMLFLDWFSQRWREPQIETGLPIVR